MRSLLPGLMLLLFTGHALGHATLVESQPDDGATLERADEAVVLRYSEGIQPRFSDFAVHFLGDDKAAALTHDNRLPRAAPEVTDRNQVVRVALPENAADGWYALDWEVLAEDGHTTSGTLRFRLAAE